jgi:hypothetical protein
MTQDSRRRYFPSPSSLSKRGLSLAIQSAAALTSGVSKRMYVVIPAVLFSALALASEITGKAVVLPPHESWLLAAIIAVGGAFLQYHHERVVRIGLQDRVKRQSTRPTLDKARPL